MSSIAVERPVPFEIAIPDADVDVMRRRIRETRWPGDFGNDGWYYGVERSWPEDFAAYWADGFDWSAQQARMNRHPHYRVVLDGVPVHFLHARSPEADARPLLLLHGWPWTLWDFGDVIEPLTDPVNHGGRAEDAFDVVVPSLPGVAFSSPLTTTGLGARPIAELWHRLMTDVLGHASYGVGGGDWGSLISAEIGHAFAESLLGVWLTLPFVPGADFASLGPDDFADDEQWMWERTLEARSVIQSHRTVHQFEPQTLAYALADSPVGTAAWLLARRRDWSDNRGDVYEAFDRDFLCTTVSLYWLTNTIGSSLRIYRETFGGGGPPPPRHARERTIDAPTAFAVFPKELRHLPRATASRLTNLRRWTVMPRGGHFAPSEVPDLVVDDLRAFFGGSERTP